MKITHSPCQHPLRLPAHLAVMSCVAFTVACSAAPSSETPAPAPIARTAASLLPAAFSCRDDAVARRHKLAPGVWQVRCERRETGALGHHTMAHGKSVVVARRVCADGRPHTLRIEREHAHGEQVGVERGSADGDLVYTRELRDVGRYAVSHPGRARPGRRCDGEACAGWGASRTHGRACYGMHLCGAAIGFAACVRGDLQTEGAHIDGVLRGYGVAVQTTPATRREGEFVDGELHGRGSVRDLDGDVFRGFFQRGRRHGAGRVTIAAGGWMTGVWLRGKQHGRVTLADAHGARVVTLWRDGQLQKFVRRYTVARRGHHSALDVSLSSSGRIARASTRPGDEAGWLVWQIEHRDGEDRLHFWRVAAGANVSRLPRPSEVPAGEPIVRGVGTPEAALRAQIAVIEAHRSKLGEGGNEDARMLSWVDHGRTEQPAR